MPPLCHQTPTLPPWPLSVDPTLMISTQRTDSGAVEMSGTSRSRRPRLYVRWYRCTGDSLDHAVTDEAFAQGLELQEGSYLAVCGHVVLIGSCLAPPGPPCVACVAVLRILNRPINPTAEPGRRRKAHRWCCLFGRHQTPAVPQSRPRQRARATPEQDGRTITSVDAGRHRAHRSRCAAGRLTTDQLITAPPPGPVVEPRYSARQLPGGGVAPQSTATHRGDPFAPGAFELPKSPVGSSSALRVCSPGSAAPADGER